MASSDYLNATTVEICQQEKNRETLGYQQFLFKIKLDTWPGQVHGNHYCLEKVFGILEVMGDFKQFETPLHYETHRNFSLYYAQN